MCQSAKRIRRESWCIELVGILPGELPRASRDGGLTDICVKVQEWSFPAHQAVLSATSPYFQGLLESGLAEAREGRIDLHGVEAHIFEQILSFMYTGRATVQGIDSAVALLVAADYFWMPDLSFLTLQLIQSKASPSHYPRLFVEGRRIANRDLEAFAHVQCCEHFRAISDDWLPLQWDVLCEVLDSEFLVIHDEEEVLDVVVRWLEASNNPEADAVVPLEGKSRLLSTVRFSCIEPAMLKLYWPRLAPHCQDVLIAQRIILCMSGREAGDVASARWVLRQAPAEVLGQKLFDFATQHREYGRFAVLLTKGACADVTFQVRRHVLGELRDARDAVKSSPDPWRQGVGGTILCWRKSTWRFFLGKLHYPILKFDIESLVQRNKRCEGMGGAWTRAPR